MKAKNFPCRIDGCARTACKREWCSKHYQRWLKHGDPLVTEIDYPDRGDTLKWIEEHLSYQGEECLVWPFHHDNKGYAKIRVNGRNMQVSRYICESLYGLPPTQHEAAHNCGRGRMGCVAPNHVRWATKAENEADKEAHGTRLKCERHPLAKLTDEQVATIRRRYTGRRGQQKKLADEYGVSYSTICGIVSGRRWALHG